MGVPLCIQRKPGSPWLRRKPERKRALKSSTERICTFQRFYGSLPQPWVLPSNQLAICNCTSLYNNEFSPRVPSSLPRASFGMLRTRTGEVFPGKMGRGLAAGERWEQEPVFIAEASPIHRLDVFFVIYKLTTPGPRAAPAPPAAVIIVWPRPGRAICFVRRAAPLPP